MNKNYHVLYATGTCDIRITKLYLKKRVFVFLDKLKPLILLLFR